MLRFDSDAVTSSVCFFKKRIHRFATILAFSVASFSLVPCASLHATHLPKESYDLIYSFKYELMERSHLKRYDWYRKEGECYKNIKKKLEEPLELWTFTVLGRMSYDEIENRYFWKYRFMLDKLQNDTLYVFPKKAKPCEVLQKLDALMNLPYPIPSDTLSKIDQHRKIFLDFVSALEIQSLLFQKPTNHLEPSYLGESSVACALCKYELVRLCVETRDLRERTSLLQDRLRDMRLKNPHDDLGEIHTRIEGLFSCVQQVLRNLDEAARWNDNAQKCEDAAAGWKTCLSKLEEIAHSFKSEK